MYRAECRGEEVAVKVMMLGSDSAEVPRARPTLRFVIWSSHTPHLSLIPPTHPPLQDIKREIKILRQCDCDQIVAYKDAFIREHQLRSTLWVVMEFCQVGS